MKNAQLANCKAETIYFADNDGNIWFCFGQTDDCLLAELVSVNEGGVLVHGTLQQLPHDRFSQVVTRESITIVGGEVTFAISDDEQDEPAPILRRNVSYRIINRKNTWWAMEVTPTTARYLTWFATESETEDYIWSLMEKK